MRDGEHFADKCPRNLGNGCPCLTRGARKIGSHVDLGLSFYNSCTEDIKYSLSLASASRQNQRRGREGRKETTECWEADEPRRRVAQILFRIHMVFLLRCGIKKCMRLKFRQFEVELPRRPAFFRFPRKLRVRQLVQENPTPRLRPPSSPSVSDRRSRKFENTI